MATAEVVTLTPAMAIEMLERDPKKRSKLERNVDYFARDISAGKWFFTLSDPILIRDDGAIINGLQRLYAVCKSDKSIKVLLVKISMDEAKYD